MLTQLCVEPNEALNIVRFAFKLTCIFLIPEIILHSIVEIIITITLYGMHCTALQYLVSRRADGEQYIRHCMFTAHLAF